MWSINDVLLHVMRVEDFIICVKPNIVFNKFMLKSMRMYNYFLRVSSLAKPLFRVCRTYFGLEVSK